MARVAGAYDLENCTMDDRLGKGAFGKVFRARVASQVGGELAAVKVVDVDSEEDRRTVLQEVSLLRGTKLHPHLVHLLGVLSMKSAVHIFLELCECSLSDVIKERRAPLPEAAVRAVTHSVLEALRFLHEELNVVHRDVKGANILMTGTGVVKLTDFNVSARLSTAKPACGTATGTPCYMAPDVITGSKYTHTADIWSLGITVLEMAEGTVPHMSIEPMAAMFRIVTSPPPVLSKPSHFSSALGQFLCVCLIKDAKGRPSAAQLLQHALFRIEPCDERSRAHTLCTFAWERHLRAAQRALHTEGAGEQTPNEGQAGKEGTQGTVSESRTALLRKRGLAFELPPADKRGRARASDAWAQRNDIFEFTVAVDLGGHPFALGAAPPAQEHQLQRSSTTLATVTSVETWDSVSLYTSDQYSTLRTEDATRRNLAIQGKELASQSTLRVGVPELEAAAATTLQGDSARDEIELCRSVSGSNSTAGLTVRDVYRTPCSKLCYDFAKVDASLGDSYPPRDQGPYVPSEMLADDYL